MKIQASQSQSFQAKRRFLNKSGIMDMHHLLNKMNSKSTCKENGSRFSSKVLAGLSINDKGYFSDKRWLLAPSDEMFGESTLEFGKVQLTFDNKTGEIIKHKKPFYKGWRSTLSEAHDLLATAKENFDNNAIIIKKFINIDGFTKKASKKLLETAEHIQQTFLEQLNGVF